MQCTRQPMNNNCMVSEMMQLAEQERVSLAGQTSTVRMQPLSGNFIITVCFHHFLAGDIVTFSTGWTCQDEFMNNGDSKTFSGGGGGGGRGASTLALLLITAYGRYYYSPLLFAYSKMNFASSPLAKLLH